MDYILSSVHVSLQILVQHVIQTVLRNPKRMETKTVDREDERDQSVCRVQYFQECRKCQFKDDHCI